MTYEFVTTFAKRHNFAKNLTNTANLYINNVTLNVYYDEMPLPESTKNIKYIKWDSSNVRNFILDAKHIQKKKIESTYKINSKDYLKNKNWMWDATRFCWKVYAMYEHSKICKSRYMIWIDSDVEFTNTLPYNFIDTIHPAGYYSSFINRPDRYTETGFLSFDTHHPYHQTFWEDMISYYTDLSIFNIKNGWTDCHVYDCARKKAEDNGIDFFDLIYEKHKKQKHINYDPWKYTPLIDFSIHHKDANEDKA